jgi:hypothetical protein
VRQHKARCVTRYDQVTAQATTYDELMTDFLASLGDTMHEEAHLHRLWYDIRAQTLFEAAFRADVVEIDKSLENMIWRIVSRFAELTGEPQTMPPSVIYAMLDGLFQQCLLKHLSGDVGRRAFAALAATAAATTIVATKLAILSRHPDLVRFMVAARVSGTVVDGLPLTEPRDRQEIQSRRAAVDRPQNARVTRVTDGTAPLAAFP